MILRLVFSLVLLLSLFDLGIDDIPLHASVHETPFGILATHAACSPSARMPAVTFHRGSRRSACRGFGGG